jgi:tetratricopeptide (TPR) repeat protein
MVKNIEKIINYWLTGLTFLLPLFFLPITTEFYDFNKNMLLMFSALGLLVLWAVKMLLEGGISFRHTQFDLPVLAVAISVLLTTFLVSPNRLETLWTANATGTMIALTILYFVITQHAARNTLIALGSAAAVLALDTIYQFVGLGEALVAENSPFAWLRSRAWTPAGGLLPLGMFLGVALTLIGKEFYQRFVKLPRNNLREKTIIIWGFASVIIALGLLVTIYQLLTAFKPLLLPYRSSWIIALEVLKFPVNLIFGVGPAGFLEAFTRFRPVFYNASNLWAIRFGLAGSYLLQILTTAGVLGLTSWLLIASQIIKNKLWPLIVILVLFVLLPGNLLLLFLFYLLLAEASSQKPVREYQFAGHINFARLALALVLIFTGWNGWQLGRIYAAETYFKKAIEAFSANKGAETYQLQIKALNLNPDNDTYYQIYAKTNFLLANSLASKKDLTDQEKQNLTTLIQQAIAQAKNATGVNPGRVTNWENLADLYRNLINFAQGADQWTVQALQQAIILDPVNPELRFTLGSVFYGLKDYDDAARYFEQAINLKSDVPNYYYNLAAAYKEKKDWTRALAGLQATAQLVSVDSADFQKLQTEIKEVQDKLPKPTATPTGPPAGGQAKSELQKPEPLPSAKLEKPIELPADAAPATSPSPPLF